MKINVQESFKIILLHFLMVGSSVSFAATDSCEAPNRLHKIFETTSYKIYEKCIDDYYDHLDEKRIRRSQQISAEISKIKKEVSLLLPHSNIDSGVVECQKANSKDNQNTCFEKTKRWNKLIDEMDKLNAWDKPIQRKKEAQPKSQAVKKAVCRTEGLKCPESNQSLPQTIRTNSCLLEFYLDQCI